MDKDFFEFMFTVTVLVFLGGVFGFLIGESLGAQAGRQLVVNELCSQKVYDFCEIDTYKLKEEKK